MNTVFIPSLYRRGKYTISVEYIGYGTIKEEITLQGNIRKNFSLKPEDIVLSAVEVTGHSTSQKTEVRKPEIERYSYTYCYHQKTTCIGW